MVSDEFEELAAQHYEALYKFAFSLTGAEADASDLTQQTFYVWATKGHQLRERSKVKTWLFTTLHRIFLEAQRRQTRFPHRGLHEFAPEDLPASSPPSDDHLDSAQVLRALAQVDEVYKGAVALFYLEDCSYREIAEILEVPQGTVKSRIARGITQLRHLMGCSASTRRRQTANPANREEPTLAAQPPIMIAGGVTPSGTFAVSVHLTYKPTKGSSTKVQRPEMKQNEYDPQKTSLPP